MGNTILPRASDRPGGAVWIATCGGLGYFPIAPGSVGAALGVALVVAAGFLPIATVWVSVLVGAAAAAILVAGVGAGGAAERHFRRKDPGQVVIDEVVGQILTFVAHPRPGWKGLAAGYLMFRVLDVIKPFPARRLEHLPRGWGIMLDDVAAGIWSLAVFSLVWEYWLK
ncbi:MAG TPA: phosphatidylglycerophosphatase A [Terriglobia bacterium]|nr:phosphatidylglycerophosphatase A [Terriglobia bacterium]